MTHDIRDLLAELFTRDISTFIQELEKFPEEKLWKTPEGIANSGGVLAQHITGNLNHFIGHGLGNSGYVRERDREFIDNGRTKEELIAALENARDLVSSILSRLDADTLDAPFPIASPFDMNTVGTLMQLYHHLSYHLGQINYLRRTLEV
jgi:hypothetical protein